MSGDRNTRINNNEMYIFFMERLTFFKIIIGNTRIAISDVKTTHRNKVLNALPKSNSRKPISMDLK
jgi:hypothetical protein